MAADPPGYFVGRPLNYQEPTPQAAPHTPPATAPADQQHNCDVTPQAPGYYSAPVPARPQPASPAPAPNSATGGSAAGDASTVQEDSKPGFLAKWFAGCFSTGGNVS